MQFNNIFKSKKIQQMSLHQRQVEISNLTKRLQHQKAKNASYLSEIQRLKKQLYEKDAKIFNLTSENKQLKQKLYPEKRDLFSSVRIQNSNPFGGYNNSIYMKQSILSKTNTERLPVQENSYNVKQKMENNTGLRANSITDLFKKKKNQQQHLNLSEYSSIPEANHTSPKKLMISNNQKVFKFLESFLIITGDLKSMQNYTVKPQIIYTFPETQTKKLLSTQTQKIIKLYTFPQRIPVKQIRPDQISNIINDKSFKTSIFLINSEYTIQSNNIKNAFNQAIETINPNYNIFGICFEFRSIIKTDKQYFEVPKTFVIITYFPFASTFINLMTNIRLTIKHDEIENFQLKNLEKIISRALDDLAKVTIGKFPINIRYKFFQSIMNLSIPQKPYTDSLIIQYATSCVSKLDSDFFVDLLLFILLEYSIIIYSNNITLLSQTILLFMYLIRPFKYPFLIIFNLPEEMHYMLDSPFPVILGSTRIKKPESLSINAYFNIDTLKLEKKPQLPNMIHCFNYIKSALKGKFSSEHQILKKVKYIINEQIINGLKKDKEGLMSPFLKVFKQTQIYKSYNQ